MRLQVRFGAALALLFAVGSAHAETPMAIAATGHVTVPVAIAGHGSFPFVLDTGAETTVVYDAFATEQRFAVDASEPVSVNGQTGTAAASAVWLPPVSFEGVTIPRISAVRLPNRGDGVPLAGIVGLDVIGTRLLTMDFRTMRAALHRSGARPAPRGALVATRILGGLLTVPVRVNGVAGTAVVDSGARETRINTRFARAAGIVATADAAAVTVHGATNSAFQLRPARARSVTLGTTALGPRRVLVADLPVFSTFGLADRPAMILGADYFVGRRLNVDFPRARVWFD